MSGSSRVEFTEGDLPEQNGWWLRRGRKADLAEIPVLKLAEAQARGVIVELDPSQPPEKKVAQVNKVVLMGVFPQASGSPH